MESVYLKIDGMSCGSCVNTVTKALAAIRGVASVGVSLVEGAARIEGTGLVVPDIETAVSDTGYDAKVLNEAAAHPEASGEAARSRGCGSGTVLGGCCCG